MTGRSGDGDKNAVAASIYIQAFAGPGSLSSGTAGARYPFAEANHAIDDSDKGEVVKPILMMEPAAGA